MEKSKAAKLSFFMFWFWKTHMGFLCFFSPFPVWYDIGIDGSGSFSLSLSLPTLILFLFLFLSLTHYYIKSHIQFSRWVINVHLEMSLLKGLRGKSGSSWYGNSFLVLGNGMVLVFTSKDRVFSWKLTSISFSPHEKLVISFSLSLLILFFGDFNFSKSSFLHNYLSIRKMKLAKQN